MHLYFLKINEGQIDKIISECSIQTREVFYMIFSLDGIFKLSPDANVLYKMNCKEQCLAAGCSPPWFQLTDHS